jgi:opacity protein-like surface antigen
MFQDKDAILSAPYNELNENISGLKASGFTLGVEYNPTDNSYFRVESRYLITDTNQKIFYDGTKTQNNRVEAILSGGIDF